MLRKVKYVNHINETLEYGKDGLYINESDLLDFTWSILSKNNHISGFSKGIISRHLTLFLKCKTYEDGLKSKNRLFEVCEKDVLSIKHGRIIIGDYYLRCYVVESKKTECSLVNGYMKLKLKVTSDLPYWVKETKSVFNNASASGGSNLDFNNDFAYDYTSNMLGEKLNNTGFMPANFKMLIYGPATNPSVQIGGHTYAVNAGVGKNEYLEIDSIAKTVVLRHADGSQTNCFHARNRNSYIFEKIPVGANSVSIAGDFMFEITLLEERSEPKWI